MNQDVRLGSDLTRSCQHCIFDDYQDVVPEWRSTLSEAKESCVTTYSTFCTGITLETDGKYYLRTSMEPVTVTNAIRKVFEIMHLVIGRC